MTLATLIGSSTHVAYSRLWRGDLLGHISRPTARVIEIPHLRGIPVAIPLPKEAVRIVEWPNAAGIREPSSSNDIVRWDPTLSPPPVSDRSIPTSPPGERLIDFDERTSYLRKLLRSLSQLPGVVEAVRPDAPIAILLTPGFATDAFARIARQFPDSAVPVRRNLGEFPGGLQLTITNAVWDDRSAYAAELNTLLREELST